VFITHARRNSYTMTHIEDFNLSKISFFERRTPPF
jgi:hypothetical protein